MTTSLRKKYTPIGFVTLLAFAWISPGCGKKEEEDPGPSQGELGADCDLLEEGQCDEGLLCVEGEGGDGVCAVAPGQPCDPESDVVENGGCGFSATCVVPMSTETAGESMGGSSGEAEGEPICLLKEGAICEPEEPHCGNDLICAETRTGQHRCFGRVVMRGMVSDTSDASAIEGAHVIALDQEGSAVTDIAVSEADGSYLLDIPVVRNDEDGTPVDDATFTLNAAAQDYQPFPSGVRVALPIVATEAVRDGNLYIIESALTDIGLIPLEAGDRALASGQIAGLGDDSNVSGLLVVATGAAGSFTAITDLSGAFTVFNLPDGEYEIKAYGAGIQIDTTTINVSGGNVVDVSLTEVDEATTTVSGQVQIVDGNGFKATSVILVVEDTFNETAARGSVPRGLRAPESGPVSVEGAFSIAGVPAGNYVVLAAYENDGLVRDPNTNTAGTDFVRIEVTAGEETMEIAESFKVTGALTTVSPGADGPEAVTEKPTLEWEDDSSEDGYHIYVYDAFGEEVWTADMGPVSGGDNVTLPYEGPLEPGMYYQFRVQSWSQPGNGDPAPISTTEDLRGVFYLPGE